MYRDCLIGKVQSIEKVKSGKSYYEVEEDLSFENPIEIVSKIFKDLTLYERVEIILATIGIDASNLNPYQIFCNILRFLPLIEGNLHTIEFGAPSTGKSSIYQKVSNKYYCISGAITESSLFGSQKPKTEGILSQYEAVAIDEVSDINAVGQELLTKLKDFLSSGNTGRYGELKAQNTSLAFLGNIECNNKYSLGDPFFLENTNIFDVLPERLSSDALKSRISYVIPGWILSEKIPLIRSNETKGLNIHLFSSYLSNLRQEEYSFKINSISELDKILKKMDTRTTNTLEKSIKAFLKLLYPNRDYSESDVVAIGEMIYACNRILYKEQININKSKDVQRLLLKLTKNKVLDDRSNISNLYYYNERFIVRLKEDEKFLYKVAITEQGKLENQLEKDFYNSANEEIKNVLLPFVSLSEDSKVAKFKSHEIFGNFMEIKLEQKKSTIIGLTESEELNNVINIVNKELENLNKDVKYLKEENKELKEVIKDMGDYLCSLRKDTDGIRSFIKEGERYNELMYLDYDFYKNPTDYKNSLFENQIEKIADLVNTSRDIKKYSVCYNEGSKKFVLLNYFDIKLESPDPLSKYGSH